MCASLDFFYQPKIFCYLIYLLSILQMGARIENYLIQVVTFVKRFFLHHQRRDRAGLGCQIASGTKLKARLNVYLVTSHTPLEREMNGVRASDDCQRSLENIVIGITFTSFCVCGFAKCTFKPLETCQVIYSCFRYEQKKNPNFIKVTLVSTCCLPIFNFSFFFRFRPKVVEATVDVAATATETTAIVVDEEETSSDDS